MCGAGYAVSTMSQKNGGFNRTAGKPQKLDIYAVREVHGSDSTGHGKKC